MAKLKHTFKTDILVKSGSVDVTLPASHPLNISMLTEDEFHAELEKGYADVKKGKVRPAEEAFASLRGELGI